MTFVPDYRHILDAAANKRPSRLPLYEHIISPVIMEQVLGVRFAPLEQSSGRDLDEFFHQYCRFWPLMTYDTISYEVCITEALPGHGAIMGGKGPIISGLFPPQATASMPEISRAAAFMEVLVFFWVFMVIPSWMEIASLLNDRT